MKFLNLFIIFSLLFNTSFANEACDFEFQKIDNGLRDRAKRRDKIDKLLKEDKHDEIYDFLVKSHDNAHAKDGVLEGFSVRREIVKTKLHKFNTDSYVSSYFQIFEKYHDTFGVIDTVIKNTDPRFAEALKDAEGWLDTYANYFKSLKGKVDEGVEAKMHLDALKKFSKTKKPKFADFMGTRTVEVELPYIKNGNIVKRKKVFAEKADYDLYIKKSEDKVKSIFSRNIYDDARFNSEIHGVMIEHEMMRRRLNFLRSTLADQDISKLNKEQKALLKRTEKLLADQKLQSRSDMVTYVQKKELRAEMRSLFKSNRSKRRGRQKYKYGQTQSFIKTIRGQAVGGVAEKTSRFTTMKFIKYTLGFSAGTTIATLIFLPITENPEYNKFRSKISNWWNNTTLKIIGTTSTLNDCAKADRTWTVEEVCYNEFLFEHLSYYFYKAQADPSYDYTKDPEFLKKREELTRIYLEKRDFKGNSQFHSTNKEYLTSIGYRAYLDDAFIELAVAEQNNSEEVAQILEKIIEADYIYEDQLLVEQYKDKLLKVTNDEFVLKVSVYIENAHLGVENLRHSGKNLQGQHLDEFMSSLSKLEKPKEAILDLNEEDKNLESVHKNH